MTACELHGGSVPSPCAAKLALLCPWDAPCTLRGVRLAAACGCTLPPPYRHKGICREMLLRNVVLRDSKGPGGGLLTISKGARVTGTNVSFINGTNPSFGGCVFSSGRFSCTGCTFSSCHAQFFGGAVDESCDGDCRQGGGGLELVRPVRMMLLLPLLLLLLLLLLKLLKLLVLTYLRPSPRYSSLTPASARNRVAAAAYATAATPARASASRARARAAISSAQQTSSRRRLSKRRTERPQRRRATSPFASLSTTAAAS